MSAVLQLTDRSSFPLAECPVAACEQIGELLTAKGIAFCVVKHRDGRVFRIHFSDLERAHQAFARLRIYYILDYPIALEGATR